MVDPVGLRPPLIRRASIATRAGSAEPAPLTASSAAWTAGNGSPRWSRRTSIRARVPPAFAPHVRRARAQNASWAAVSTPRSRAWRVASAPGIAPGLRERISR